MRSPLVAKGDEENTTLEIKDNKWKERVEEEMPSTDTLNMIIYLVTREDLSVIEVGVGKVRVGARLYGLGVTWPEPHTNRYLMRGEWSPMPAKQEGLSRVLWKEGTIASDFASGP